MIVLRSYESGCPNQSIGPRAILDDDGLAPAFPQAFREYASSNVGRTARRNRHDHADGPLRPGLCRRWNR
jgi:hypothetical protein